MLPPATVVSKLQGMVAYPILAKVEELPVFTKIPAVLLVTDSIVPKLQLRNPCEFVTRVALATDDARTMLWMSILAIVVGDGVPINSKTSKLENTDNLVAVRFKVLLDVEVQAMLPNGDETVKEILLAIKSTLLPLLFRNAMFAPPAVFQTYSAHRTEHLD